MAVIANKSVGPGPRRFVATIHKGRSGVILRFLTINAHSSPGVGTFPDQGELRGELCFSLTPAQVLPWGIPRVRRGPDSATSGIVTGSVPSTHPVFTPPLHRVGRGGPASVLNAVPRSRGRVRMRHFTRNGGGLLWLLFLGVWWVLGPTN